jgi:Domain of unknown function (DUF4350)
MSAPVTDRTAAGGDAAGAGEETGSEAGGRPAGNSGVTRGLLRAWRSSWLPLLLAALFAVGILLSVVLLSGPPRTNDYLDPSQNAPGGALALADILSEHGFAVTEVYNPAAALAAVGPARPGSPSVTLLITSPDLLTSAQRQQLARADADLFLVEPTAASLRALAPAVHVANPVAPFGGAIDPSCGLTGARLAGPATAGGISYRIPGYATGCYLVAGHPSVVRYLAADRLITIIGNGQALSDGYLGRQGNAALALNLLNANHRIVWLTPEPTIATITRPRQAQNTKPPLVPAAAWLVVLQLAVALLLAAWWRGRRFGPLITERLPVVVRASETVEGHAGLYQARRSRDRAAAALRAAMLSRIIPALGLPAGAPGGAVIDALASRSTLTRAQVEAIGYGPAPASDVELVKLANELDELEREVLSR